MSVQVSYKKQFILGIFLIILVLFVIELFSQTYYFQKSEDCFLIDRNVYANLTEKSKKQICHDLNDLLFFDNGKFVEILPNQNYQTITINSDGFRGTEITELTSNNKLKIFVVGGSTVFGWASTSDNTTIPSYLQEFFDKESDLQVQVVNVGMPDAWSFTELNIIKQEILQYEPDIIVVYDGWNDVNKSLKKWLNHIEIKNTIHDEISQVNVDNSIRKILSNFKTTTLVRSLSSYFEESSDQTAHIRAHGEYANDMAKEWSDNIKKICNLGKTENFKTVIILQPLLGTGNLGLTEFEKKLVSHYNHDGLLNSYHLFEKSLEPLQEHCTLTSNYLDVFDNENYPIFYDSGHTTDDGNKLVAKRMFNSLMSIIR